MGVQLEWELYSAGAASIEQDKDAGRALSMGAGISFLFLYMLEAQTVLMRHPALGLRVHKDDGRRLATEPNTPGEGWRKHGQVKQQPGSNSHLLFHGRDFVLACMRLTGSDRT